MNEHRGIQPRNVAGQGFSSAQVALIALVTAVLTVAVAFFVLRAYVFPAEIKPVELTGPEQQQLDRKLGQLGWHPELGAPEPYSEAGADREIVLTEREISALLADDPELGRRVAIDLSADLVSAKMLVAVPPDFPVMPGRNIRVDAGFEVRLDDSGKPVVALRGVSVMGIPVPNAWLGNLKNVDLVTRVGDEGFWNTFAAAVEDVRVRDGEVFVRLRE